MDFNVFLVFRCSTLAGTLKYNIYIYIYIYIAITFISNCHKQGNYQTTCMYTVVPI